MGQGGIHERVVGNHPLDVGPAAVRIHLQHMDQFAGGQPLILDRAVSEQVRQRLVEGPFGAVLRTSPGQGVRECPGSTVVVGSRVRVVGGNHPAARGAEDSPTGRCNRSS